MFGELPLGGLPPTPPTVLPDGIDDGAAALAEAQHVDLARDLVTEQAVALAIAETATDRLQIQAEMLDAGTGESIVRDRACHAQMSLRAWVRHCRRVRHTADDVEVITVVCGPPVPDVPDVIPLPPRIARAQRARVRQQLLDDPEVRARMAGIAGEVYRPDDDEEP